MMQLFHTVSENCSKLVTNSYSSSFSSAIRLLHKDLRTPIYNIYGFVRFADEIVDTFHEHDKAFLMQEFKKETFDAIERGLSLNPILNSFQKTVNQYDIDHELIHAFFHSMELDLSKTAYDKNEYREYIYGSAEVVGLMCLTIFCEGNKELYDRLKEPARALGAAFQKVNFLRDIKSDYTGLSRMYFPNCDFMNFSCRDKKEIEADIENDFRQAYQGILQLPVKARFGVYVAYRYYSSLFKKIKRMHPERILNERIRIPDLYKAMIVLRAGVKNQLKLI
ncbi:MAG TPA: phytoene/squalene synthase family protein [Chitinophagaceae bacterium]|jgi:phytoene/squalene synthetase|nr:phytoene/squalene synthase family protein [Chitinophagaceae bacterium]